ncbi:MAG: hypothetical protein A2X93_08420 [Deltaproteobacteria bacterium GWC2_56_8]|nr:MAG: hypothetical protein A2X99_08285 [Deltaproteobacteria bacterium GWB2_55_19]OGP35269.1 MAG: hypothetical protein A2X93_08420 [Deltaproteobacteria bacterium GWC2_56_8]HAO94234.1 hypothetical protein [Deltaproteobacteria bacterium]
MKKFLAASLVFAATLATAATASAVVDVEGRYWFTNMDGTVQVSNGAVGTELDIVDDLGMEDKNFFEGRVTLELGSHKLRYGYMPLKWSGSTTLTESVTFAGQTYTASADVDSELNLAYHRLGYEYDFIDLLNNKLGVIVELKYFDGDASLASAALGLDESETFKLPIPTVGVAAQVGLPMIFSVGGEITGISLGSSAYLVDAEAAVNLKPAPFVIISGGYRIFKMHAESDNDLAEVSLSGPFLSLRADF